MKVGIRCQAAGSRWNTHKSKCLVQWLVLRDLLAIVHTFSCRLYGLRSYSKKIKEIITNPPSQSS